MKGRIGEFRWRRRWIRRRGSRVYSSRRMITCHFERTDKDEGETENPREVFHFLIKKHLGIAVVVEEKSKRIQRGVKKRKGKIALNDGTESKTNL